MINEGYDIVEAFKPDSYLHSVQLTLEDETVH